MLPVSPYKIDNYTIVSGITIVWDIFVEIYHFNEADCLKFLLEHSTSKSFKPESLPYSKASR